MNVRTGKGRHFPKKRRGLRYISDPREVFLTTFLGEDRVQMCVSTFFSRDTQRWTNFHSLFCFVFWPTLSIIDNTLYKRYLPNLNLTVVISFSVRLIPFSNIYIQSNPIHSFSFPFPSYPILSYPILPYPSVSSPQQQLHPIPSLQ